MKREFSNKMKRILNILCGFSLLVANQVSAKEEARKLITVYGYEKALVLKARYHAKERYLLQMNAFKSLEHAVHYKRILASQVKAPIRVVRSPTNQNSFAVVLGPFDSLQQLKAISNQVKKSNVSHKKQNKPQKRALALNKTIPLIKKTDKKIQQITTHNHQQLVTSVNNLPKSTLPSTPEKQPIPHSLESDSPTQFLLEQVKLGEATFKEELIQQALDKLDKIEPNNPMVIAAHIRLSLFQKNEKLAQQQLEQLKQIAPDSAIYRQSQLRMQLAKPEVQLQLQNAKVLALGGKYDEAKQAYDTLFHGVFPTPEIAADYWINASKIPSQQQEAFKQLQLLYLDAQRDSSIAQDPNSERLQKSVRSTLANLIISQADIALKQAKLDVAKQHYEKAKGIDPTNSYAVIGLGDVAFEEKNYPKAEAFYKEALAVENTYLAHYRMVSVLQKKSPQSALNYLETLPNDFKARMKDRVSAIEADIVQKESDVLQQQAKNLETSKNWPKIIANYDKALKLTPNDVWLVSRFARALQQSGQPARAMALFKALAAKQPKNPEQVYAHALFLSNIDQKTQAIKQLNTLPRNLWTKDISELSKRLTIELAIDYAQKIRDGGDKKAAIAYLKQQRSAIPIELKLATWALDDEQYFNALAYYQKVKSQDPKNSDALLGEIETYIALKQLTQAKEHLERLSQHAISNSLNEQRRIANAWSAVGELQKAAIIFQRLQAKANRSIENQDNALIFRDAGNLARKRQKYQDAQRDYAQAMVSSGITSELPKTNEVYTYLTRNNRKDDWLKRGIRSDAANLYLREDTTVTVNERYSQLAGTPGYSDLNAYNTMTQADFPLFNGRGFIRDDFVKLNAGNFATVDGVFDESFGTCSTTACSSGISQTANGNGFAAGWVNESWIVDAGTSPIGFKVVNFVGSVGYSSALNNISWTLMASRRPMTNSLLSFAGTVDPNTGIVWGGAVASGLNLALSYDRGKANGFWSNLAVNTITGKNVATNQRVRLMDGYYYKWINEDNRRATIGLNNMIWHYQKDLSGYTLGQGGYYSPQFYLSFGLPIYYRQRTENWSFEFGGTGTWSTATTQNSLLYPLPELLPTAIRNENTVQTGGTSSGLGYSLLFIIERRLSNHFFIGAGLDIQRSRDYTPSNAILYVRHSLNGWKGDLDLPPRPLVPYGDFR